MSRNARPPPTRTSRPQTPFQGAQLRRVARRRASPEALGEVGLGEGAEGGGHGTGLPGVHPSREIEGRRGWRLQFDVRSATQTDIAAHQSAAEGEGFLDEAAWQECQQLIEVTFASDGKAQPAALAKRLGEIVSMNRTEWPTSFCRRIWEALILFESGRRRIRTAQ